MRFGQIPDAGRACALLLIACAGCGGGGGGGGTPAPAATATLSASAASVFAGGSVTLTWSSTNAGGCTGSGAWSGTKATSGSEQVGPIHAASTFTLTCATASVNATVTITPAPTVTLTANPATISGGDASTLTWSSTNSTACTASGAWTGSRATSGTEQVGPLTADATYTMTCGAGNVTGSQSVTVVVASTVSGRLLVTTFTQTDSDTNEVNRTPVSNGTFATAQRLPNPAIVGGYATVAGSGPQGAVRDAGDVDDLYGVALLQDQVVELAIASPTEGDLDLALYNSSQVLVNASTGDGASERLTVPSAGDYFVRIFAFSGSSNYVLTIGQTGGTTNTSATLQDEFVPGEMLAKFAPSAASGKTDMRSRLAKAQGFTIRSSAPDSHSLLKLTQTAGPMSARAKPSLDNERGTLFASELDRRKWETLYAIKALSRNPAVLWAEPNFIVHRNAVPNDPEYSKQRWHYEQIRLPDAWNVTTGNSNVIAAVIDSGVRPHTEFSNRLVSGYDFVSDIDNAGDGNGRDSDPADPGELVQGRYVFHGTHVAGTIGAAGNNASGVAGVAWNVRLMPIRVIGIENGTGDDVINGMRYAARLSNASGTLPAQRADIINMSLGSTQACPQAFQDAVTAVRAAGVIVVAAAGNDSRNGIQPSGSPANCAGVISVAALGINSQRAPYSNAGANVDIAAPGGDDVNLIYSTYSAREGSTYFSTYDYLQGTSMACPHVAGVIALMKSVNSSLTPAAVDSLLASGALTDDIGPTGPDELGIGRINALKAITAAAGSSAPVLPGQLSVTLSSLNFGEVATANTVTVSNSGTQTVSLASIVSSESWLTATAVQVDANGLGTYRINVNRSSLSVGTYSGTVEFRGSTGTAAVTSVQMQVTNTPGVADAGVHYVLLVDPQTQDTVYQTRVDARGAAVAYTFTNVTPGSYLLIAGTDSNNDNFICDEGEACGQYPLYGEAAEIVVVANATGLDIVTAYRSSVRLTGTDDAQKETGDRRRSYRRLH